jgi:alpha-1,3-glucosyltransferase
MPPKYGDFEAQRHWLEITYHLPIKKWYRYDLEYWGLDYPPLTAYHSWLLGSMYVLTSFLGGISLINISRSAHWFNPEWIALDTSRGIESEGVQLFMRYTAIFTDLIIYSSAVYMIAFKCHAAGKDWISQNMLYIAILFQPALIIIDHGHFQ